MPPINSLQANLRLFYNYQARFRYSVGPSLLQGTQRYYKLSDITYYLITNRYNARGGVAMRYFGRDFAGVSHNQYRTHSIAQ